MPPAGQQPHQRQRENYMKLDQFVSETLTSLFKGVTDAQDALADGNNGARIIPGQLTASDRKTFGVSPYGRVKFEVALGKEEADGGRGCLGVMLGPVDVGVRGTRAENEVKTGSLTRINFAVPIKFPDQSEKTT